MSNWTFWVATTVIGLMISGLMFFIKKQFTDLEKANERTHAESVKAREALNSRIEKLEVKLQTTIEEMPYKYTLREDFIRAVSGLERKIDKILDALSAGKE